MKRSFLTLLGLATFLAGTVSADAVRPHDNIALGRAVYQSGSADDHKCGHLTTDGSDSTFWRAPRGAGGWIYVDLGAECEISSLEIVWGDNPSIGFVLQVAGGPTTKEGVTPRNKYNFSGLKRENYTPTTWKDIDAAPNIKGGTAVIDLASPAKGRYVRLEVTSGFNPTKGAEVREFRVFGAPVKPLTVPDVKKSPSIADGSWKICHTMFAGKDGDKISSPGYDDASWIPAKVPGTILGSYVEAGALPDPFYGDQMSMISEEFFSYGSFWYRSSFSTPAGLKSTDKVFLDFGGVNWKSEVYVNGTHVGGIRGAFIRSRFDVTEMLSPSGDNHVAVLIRRLDNPVPSQNIPLPEGGSKAKVLHKYIGAHTANGDMLTYDSPTYLASSGWNWLPIVRGRDLGIWDHVKVTVTGGVEVCDPWITSTLNLPDTTKAALTVETTLRNRSSSKVDGTLKVVIDGKELGSPVTLAAGETRTVRLDAASFPQLFLTNPRLWWPNGYGEANLYKARVSFEVGKRESDVKTFDFGIRDLKCTAENGIMFIYVNGYRILLRGGNWGMAEGMLRCDSAGYDIRVRLHKEANFNMIRNWVGQTAHREFYDACNRFGMLVFDDFWLANPGDGPDPTDYKMFMDNVYDKILAVRHNPCVAFYCGRNEGMPPESLDEAMRDAVAKYDPTRHYEPNSAGGLLTGLGPYEPKTEKWYFQNRGITFHSELGIIAIPEAESIREMMPAENIWPINDMWAVHDYQTPRSQIFSQFLSSRYGMPLSLDAYCQKAQMFGMENARAMFESLKDHQGSGLLLWMSQSAWPSLICQIYDHYFEPTASFFATRRACAPVSIHLNPLTGMVRAANNTIKPLSGLRAEIGIYNLDGRKIDSKSATLNIGISSAADCFKADVPEALKGKTYFIKLSLFQGDKLLADNFYWHTDGDSTFLALNSMKKVKVQASASKRSSGGVTEITVKLRNGGDGVALMTRLKLRDRSGDRILPVSYDDNYISMLPGESRTVSVKVESELLKGLAPVIAIEGWNVTPSKAEVR